MIALLKLHQEKLAKQTQNEQIPNISKFNENTNFIEEPKMEILDYQDISKQPSEGILSLSI